jgi:hypothetical protein
VADATASPGREKPINAAAPHTLPADDPAIRNQAPSQEGVKNSARGEQSAPGKEGKTRRFRYITGHRGQTAPGDY